MRSITNLLVLAPLCVGAQLIAQDAASDRAVAGPGQPRFVMNQGQWPEGLAARSRVGSGTAWFHDRGLVLVLEQMDRMQPRGAGAVGGAALQTSSATLRLRFQGGAAATTPVGVGRSDQSLRFIRGGADTILASSFGALRYPNLYKGIDAIFRGDAGRIAYDFEVQAGTRCSTIEIACEGLSAPLTIDADGSLVLETELGVVTQTAPRSFELLGDGTRVPVPSRFVLRGRDRYGFAVERSDSTRALLIDPGISWSTFVGGRANENLAFTDRVSPGRFVAAGRSQAAIPAPWGTRALGSMDAYVTLIDTTLPGARAVVWAAVIGGASHDAILGIAYDDSTKLITVVGTTNSTKFPVTSNARQSSFAGSYDGFLTQLDRNGRVVYSTYLGHTGDDRIVDVSANGGRLAIVGATTSGRLSMTGSAWQRTIGGGMDAFVAILDPRFVPVNQLLASTFVGGTASEGGAFNPSSNWKNFDLKQVHMAANGEVTISIHTHSGLATTAGAFRATNSGGGDTWVGRFDPALSTLRYATFLGGPKYDLPLAMHVDTRGVVTVSGVTQSRIFPTTAGAFGTTYSGSNDVYLARVDPSQTGAAQLRYGAFLGGAQIDEPYGISVEPSSGIVTLVGQTQGLGRGTTSGAFQRGALAGARANGFILRAALNGAGTNDIHYLSYLTHTTKVGINHFSLLIDVVADSDGRFFLVGATNQPSFPIGRGGPQTAHAGGADGFAVLMDLLPFGATPIGTSSPACAPPSWMQVNSQPMRNNARFTMFCENAPANAPGFLLVGLPRPAGTPILGVNLFLNPLGMVMVPVRSDARGLGQLRVPLPGTLTFPTGAAAQFVWVPARSCGGTQFRASSALQL